MARRLTVLAGVVVAALLFAAAFYYFYWSPPETELGKLPYRSDRTGEIAGTFTAIGSSTTSFPGTKYPPVVQREIDVRWGSFFRPYENPMVMTRETQVFVDGRRVARKTLNGPTPARFLDPMLPVKARVAFVESSTAGWNPYMAQRTYAVITRIDLDAK